MVHTAEGTLQAYLDGEIADAAARALSDHVAGCAACAAELDALRRMNSRVGEALALLDGPSAARVVRARAAIAGEGRYGTRRIARLGAWGLAKAAMLTLVLAAAGVAAIPDVRRALETTFSRVVALFSSEQERTAVPAEPAPADPPAVTPGAVPGASYVTPASGRVEIALEAPTGRVEVVVELVAAAQAEVRTATDDPVRRRVGVNGRLELIGLGPGVVTIAIPRDVRTATVEVDGVVRVYKEGDLLRVAGSEADARGSEVRFIVGS
jgi:anti-sigma factor RsiW